MWGSTTPNTADECNWAKAPFNGGASSYDDTYFNSVKDTICPNNVLAKEYDAATQIMGGDWRMPTQTECQELLDNTAHVWIEDFNGSGVNGCKFTSKTDTSKYIFIPAAGYYDYGSVHSVGDNGRVWSSSLHASGSDNAWYLNFFNDYEYDDFYYEITNHGRFFGFCVRGVFE